MKDPLERTKVVLRHLPSSLTEPALMEQIDGKFAGRYKWLCFRPGKNSQKNPRYSRAYIDFKNPEDVFEFAEFFDGHVFVNEKGTQFKVLVEYAPSQCIPKPRTKKDGREGTIFKDPEYLEFLELLTKPTENLPSAEIQLERREAERAGAAKEVPIVTPLMDFIRKKRAAKSGPQRMPGNGKSSRRAVIAGNSSSPYSKRGSDKRRGPNLMYVSRDNPKNESGKEQQTYILMPRRDERLTETSTDLPSTSRKEDIQVETVTGRNGTISAVPVSVETGKKALLLLKGKERGSSHIQQLEAPGRIIRSILSNKERQQVLTSQSDPQLINGNTEKDKRPPRPPVPPPNLKERASGLLHVSASDANGKSNIDDLIDSNKLHAFTIENKHDKRMRNKDRPDRGVWAPLRRSDGSYGRGTTNGIPFYHEEIKHDSSNGNRNSEFKSLAGGRGSHALENGTQRHVGRRGSAHVSKELDHSSTTAEGKPLKRGPPSYGSHEVSASLWKCFYCQMLTCTTNKTILQKQVWVQKSGSAS
ncbi:regulator of nonsense transcripts UPF3 isoform X2 [Dendrobium catenatum]|uniref:regulator of nonsense transcripts UPF3 isoform X2 n=1 Tax=Dendrobium catenatum TaxID=906689 RepID=UPI00109F971F|nr:regulator of nonsense transcripts UPF3 isoform X2 [Dendrobium catenatum]